jgi:hypothetical protein
VVIRILVGIIARRRVYVERRVYTNNTFLASFDPCHQVLRHDNNIDHSRTVNGSVVRHPNISQKLISFARHQHVLWHPQNARMYPDETSNELARNLSERIYHLAPARTRLPGEIAAKVRKTSLNSQRQLVASGHDLRGRLLK